MHKIPASIGLGTFLRHKGLEYKTIAKHIISFTSSAPIACIITYLFLCGYDMNVQYSMLQYYVGILLLISSGTFIYVSTIHILPEVYCLEDEECIEHEEKEHQHSHIHTDHDHNHGLH